MNGAPRVRLADGIALRPMPFGGAFVVDPAKLEAQEICAALAGLLSGGSLESDGGQPAGPLAAQVDAGLREGWLIAEPAGRPA